MRFRVRVGFFVLCCLCGAGCGEEQFHFKIDRSAWLSVPTNGPTEEMEVLLFLDGRSKAFTWPGQGPRTDFEVLNKSSAIVSASVVGDRGGSIEKPVRDGDVLCIVDQGLLDMCEDDEAPCRCENLASVDAGLADAGGSLDVCGAVEPSTTLALYTFDDVEKLGFDETRTYPADIGSWGGDPALLSAGLGFDRCGGVASLTLSRAAGKSGEFLSIYSPSDADDPDRAVFFEELRRELRAVSFAIHRNAASSEPMTIIAAETEEEVRTQFAVLVSPAGHLVVRVATGSDNAHYCFPNAIKDGDWTEVGVNLRDGELDALIDGVRRQPSDTGLTCSDGRPQTPIVLGDEEIVPEARITIGVAFVSPFDARWFLDDSTHLDNLRLHRTRL